MKTGNSCSVDIGKCAVGNKMVFSYAIVIAAQFHSILFAMVEGTVRDANASCTALKPATRY